jgi:MoaA/NifB/PqqE/SkfB family radical SAM enzyme
MTNSDFSVEETQVHQQILSLQLSWNCNAACRQCMVSGKEKRSRIMSLSEAKRLLDQLHAMPLTHFVGFTGGEPFLHYDLLLELGRYIQEKYGYPFGAATNCFWAKDRPKARAMLSPLVDRGLRELLVSLDDFHLEFIDGKRIENCIHVALSLGMHVTVQTIITRTGHNASYFREHMDIPQSLAIRWVETPCHPAGRAVSQVPESEYVREWCNKPDHCTALHVWNVDPQGRVTPCCGTACSRPLKVGNSFEEDLSVIVNRTNVSPLINTIAAWGGPYLLIKMLEKRGDFRYSNRMFASHCDACDTVLQDREVLEVLDQELPVHWLEALASRLMATKLWYRSFILQDKSFTWLPAGWVDAEPDSAQEAQGGLSP